MNKKSPGTVPKLVLSCSRDIPFSQLVLSQKNVRRVKAGLSIEDLAEDINHRTLLQSINVRAALDADGKETGMFEVPPGGCRFRALELLVKSRRMEKDQPVPCVVRDAGIAEEDSLAENVMRVALHPFDQFRAFSALIEAGLSEEDIAARFFVSVSTVGQRLRLASVAPSLLEFYGEDGMSLEQLMAFSVTDNHARQEQVWQAQVAEVEEFTQSELHIITGLLLPIWKQFPAESTRIYRLQTGEGTRIVGRRVSPAWAVNATAIADAPVLSPPQALALLHEGHAVLGLADGLQLRRSRLMQRNRIELTGFGRAAVDRLKAMGLFSEIISWKLRLFVPDDVVTGSAAIERLFERHPLTRIADRKAA